MKKIYLRISLMIGLCVAVLSACRGDEASLLSGNSPVAEVAKNESEPIAIGEQTFEITMPEVSVLFDASGHSGSDEESRAIRLKVPDTGNYPKMVFDLPTVHQAGEATSEKKEPFYVMLILRNNNPSSPRKYYSTKPVEWELVGIDGQDNVAQVRVKAPIGGVRFSPLDDSTPQLQLSDLGSYNATQKTYALKASQDDWYLDAISIPNLKADDGGYNPELWDNTKKHLKFTAIMPKRFFRRGESLEYGKDISFPFVLKHIDLSNNRKQTGIPVKVELREPSELAEYYRTHPTEARGTAIGFKFMMERSVKRKAGESAPNKGYTIRMEPVGSLFGMEYENRIDESSQLINGDYWSWMNSQRQPVYDYRVKGVSYGSSIASGAGFYNLGDLSSQGGGDLNWDVEPNKVSFNDGVSLQPSDWIDLKNKQSTGWYYTWLHELPANRKRDDGYISFYLNLYNTTLDIEMQSFRAFSTYKPVNASAYEEGKAYYKHKVLKSELRPLPLMLMGHDYIAFSRESAMWADSAASNNDTRPINHSNINDPGVGSRYNFEQTKPFNTISSNNDPRFKVARKGRENTIFSNLLWMMPDLRTVRSVFPSPHDGLNTGNDYTNLGRCRESLDEDVRIEGLPYKDMKAVYCRLSKDDSGCDPYSMCENSVSTYYGIRFLGTEYASAYRYILKGRWHTSLSEANIEDNSRFIIQSKRISTKVGIVNGQYNREAAEKYLKEVVAKGDFWTRSGSLLETETKYLNPNVVTRTIHAIGIPRGKGAGYVSIGRSLSLWIWNDPNLSGINRTKASYYLLTGVSGGLSHKNNYSSVHLTILTFSAEAGIIPFLAPSQSLE